MLLLEPYSKYQGIIPVFLSLDQEYTDYHKFIQIQADNL
ncbi:hypothetical protein P278_20880 [Zhouia amylolytica AD3]|uniref:Uncharacterized protein n=1 Tax=Zhouia amylolytica AD3 TaxID=1286632 RepID=W2UL83_9FLAO|nr:hypothetical protein P278_20880 [Zhouia amylolytica AD3]